MALMGHQVYSGSGWDRSFYLVLLTPHVTLAALVRGSGCALDPPHGAL